MTAIVDMFADHDILGVQNITGLLVLTLDADGLLDFQDDEGMVMVRLTRPEIEAMYSHNVEDYGTPIDGDKTSCITPIAEHEFNDPNICEVFTHKDRMEMILNGQVVERLCVRGEYQLRLTGADIEVMMHGILELNNRHSLSANDFRDVWEKCLGRPSS